MTVALFMSEPHTFEGSPAYTVTCKEVATGLQVGSFVLVLLPNKKRKYITPSGQELTGADVTIDKVLQTVCQRPKGAQS